MTGMSQQSIFSREKILALRFGTGDEARTRNFWGFAQKVTQPAKQA
jgi:hypothetical protein